MIQQRSRLERTQAHRVALDCLTAGIDAADPGQAVRETVTVDADGLVISGHRYDRRRFDEITFIGAGKAVGPIAAELEKGLGEWLTGGIVVTPTPVETVTLESIVGGHPLPDAGSLQAGRRIAALAEDASARTLVIVAVTGGTSALMTAPPPSISLDDLRFVTRGLLDEGAAIGAINTVRSHCSTVKGGQLAALASPATVEGLLISDVVGDDLRVIGSGPTAPDPTTYTDARRVLEESAIDAPRTIRRHLRAGDNGEIPDTPTADSACFDRVRNHVIANAWTALEAAREVASRAGFSPCVLASRLTGEAQVVGRLHAAIATEVVASGHPVTAPAILLSGGETTVSVTGAGSGGPNLETAVSAAMDLPSGVVIASIDTDGADGSTPVAGAILDAETVGGHREAARALAVNDTHGYLANRAGTIHTGPTGTNVNDLRVVVVPQ